MDKKGVSPVIATVLLVAIVIILAAIIFIWASSFVEEALQKQDKPPKQACEEIDIEVVYSSSNGNLQVVNNGNIPIYSFIVKGSKGGISVTKEPNEPVRKGSVTNVNNIGTGYEEVTITPEIKVKSEETGEEKKYTCKNNNFIANNNG